MNFFILSSICHYIFVCPLSENALLSSGKRVTLQGNVTKSYIQVEERVLLTLHRTEIPSTYRTRIRLHDTHTRREIPATQWNQIWSRSSCPNLIHPNLYLSPNKQHLLVHQQSNNVGVPNLFVTLSLNSTTVRKQTFYGSPTKVIISEPLWLWNNKNFLFLVGTQKGIYCYMYDITKPKPTRIIPLGTPYGTLVRPFGYRVSLLGYTLDHRILAIGHRDFWVTSKNGGNLFSFNMNKTPHIKTIDYAMPQDWQRLEVALSPNKKWLLWGVLGTYVLQNQTFRGYHVVLSTIDATHFSLVGSIPKKAIWGSPDIFGLQWGLNDKEFFLSIDSTLWKFPVKPQIKVGLP